MTIGLYITRFWLNRRIALNQRELVGEGEIEAGEAPADFGRFPRQSHEDSSMPVHSSRVLRSRNAVMRERREIRSCRQSWAARN
jgi:hypothetical protein